MTPSTKENLLLVLLLGLGFILASMIFLSICGCASDPFARRHTSSSESISAAARDASLIDSKTVIVEQWLRSH